MKLNGTLLKPIKSIQAEQETVDVSGDDLSSAPVESIRKVIKQDLDKLREENAENATTEQLQTDGVESFSNAYTSLLNAIETKQAHISA